MIEPVARRLSGGSLAVVRDHGGLRLVISNPSMIVADDWG